MWKQCIDQELLCSDFQEKKADYYAVENHVAKLREELAGFQAKVKARDSEISKMKQDLETLEILRDQVRSLGVLPLY